MVPDERNVPLALGFGHPLVRLKSVPDLHAPAAAGRGGAGEGKQQIVAHRDIRQLNLLVPFPCPRVIVYGILGMAEVREDDTGAPCRL